VSGWTKEALVVRGEAFAREHEGDAFVAAVSDFSRQALDRRERALLYDVLMEKADVRGMIKDAAADRRRSGWTRRMLEGRLGRRRRPDRSA
jgi:hypothetical protein